MPDWSVTANELHCPLCEYNLRGLVTPRCPECGFVFTWAELLQGQANKHPYLFEHQRKRNIWSFWKTYWRDCRPRRFWREVNPANETRLWRLLIFWLIACSLPFTSLLLPVLPDIPWMAQRNISWRNDIQSGAIRTVQGWPSRSLNDIPLPWTFGFLKQIANECRHREVNQNCIGPAIMMVLWPILSLITLMIFRVSMRQARIDPLHVLRCVLYSCDFGLLIFLYSYFAPPHGWNHGDWTLAIAVCLCAVVATYRLGFAYSRYLRFPRPWVTVIASQTIVFLALFIACLWLEMSF